MIRWFNQLRARLLCSFAYEWGGMLWEFDLRSRDLHKICQWVDQEWQREAKAYSENVFTGSHDAIHVVVLKQGERRGYFCVYSSERKIYNRAFWTTMS